jgi:hypothetical protein
VDWIGSVNEDQPKKQPSKRKKVLKGKNKYWIKKESRYLVPTWKEVKSERLDKKKKIEDKRTIKKELTCKRNKQKRKRERERMDKNNGSTYFVGKRELLDRKRKYLERSKRERLQKRGERKKPDGKRNHKTTCKRGHRQIG